MTSHTKKRGTFKIETESLLIAAQNNAIRTNNIKTRIDKTQQNSGDRVKMISHIKGECSKVPKKEYKTRHEWVGKVIFLKRGRKLDWTIRKNGICTT